MKMLTTVLIRLIISLKVQINCEFSIILLTGDVSSRKYSFCAYGIY